MAGYHVAEIEKGKFGELSKIKEELDEVFDAAAQQNKIMVLVELSDILGAIQGYLDNHYKGIINTADLLEMAKATHKAFKSGHRK